MSISYAVFCLKKKKIHSMRTSSTRLLKMLRPRPRPPPFPYTTLFRSEAAVHGADSNRLGKARHFDSAAVAGKRRGFDRKRPAAQNHSARKIRIGRDALS